VKKVISALIKYGIPVAVSVGLAVFLYKNVDIAAIKRSLNQDVNYWWFVPVIVVSILSHVFRALRWRLQLRAIDVRPPVLSLVNSIFGTYFVNLLFPRLGEVWRCGYIARRENAPFAAVLGSMVGDRLSDTVTVAILTAITAILSTESFMKFMNQRNGDDGGSGVWMWVIVGALVVPAVLAVLWLRRTRSTNPVVVSTRRILRQLWDGFIAITRMEGKWQFLLYTILIWTCYFMQLYIASKAFTFTRDLGVLPVLVLFVLSSIGMAVPSNGGLGAWQVAIIFGLSLYGVGAFPPTTPYDPQASAFAWLVWGVQTMLLIALGIFAFACIALERKKEPKSAEIPSDGSGPINKQ